MNCPICNTLVKNKIKNTPYWECLQCDTWFQNPLPEKVYEADHEKDAQGNFTGHLMSEHDKSINQGIANWIYRDYLNNNAKVLDIGSKYPYLAYCFKNLGCDAYGLDNISIVPEYSKLLNVPMLLVDFESTTNSHIKEQAGVENFDLITMVHVFEHMYYPRKILQRLRSLLKPSGYLYIRSPDHTVSGYERDLTAGHYTIHPFFYSRTSYFKLLENLFTIEYQNPLIGFGQRDLILKS